MPSHYGIRRGRTSMSLPRRGRVRRSRRRSGMGMSMNMRRSMGRSSYHMGGGIRHSHPHVQNRMGPGMNPANNIPSVTTGMGRSKQPVVRTFMGNPMHTNTKYGPVPSTGRHIQYDNNQTMHMVPNSAPITDEEKEWMASHMWRRGGRVRKKHLGGPVHNHPHRAMKMAQPRGRGRGRMMSSGRSGYRRGGRIRKR